MDKRYPQSANCGLLNFMERLPVFLLDVSIMKLIPRWIQMHGKIISIFEVLL